MALAAAQHGFYSAVPENWKVNRYAKAKGRKLPMPDYSDGEYLYEWLQRLGFFRSPAPGLRVSLSHADLLPFFQLQKIVPEVWEVDAIIDASRAYVHGFSLGANEAGYSPMEMEQQ